MSTVTGVQGEERHEYTKAESRQIRTRSLRLLGSLLHPLRPQLWLTLAIIVVSTAAQVAGPAIIAYGIDRGLPALMEQDWMPVGLAGLAYLLTGAVGAFLIAWYIRLAARISQAVLIDLRTRVFLHTQKLSLEFHESYTSGRIISRQTSDLDAIRELLDEGINQLIRGVLYMVFTAIALVWLDWVAGLVLVATLLPLALLTRWFQMRSQRLFRRSRVASAKLIVQFVETMTGIRAVQAFRKERRNEGEFGDLVEDYRDVNARVLGLFAIYNPSLALIGNIAVAAVLLIGGFRVVDGALEVGVLLATVLYTKRFFDPMEELAMFYNSYQSASAALEKLSGVLEERPNVAEPDDPIPLPEARGELEFDGVRFGYTDRLVQPRLDIAVPAWQTVALVGATGAGKSTLARLAARFYDPVAGGIRLDGVPLNRLTDDDLRRAVVMVTQESFLFSGTIADNIAFGRPGASRSEIEGAARAIGAHEFIAALPQGYDTDVHRRGGRLSAGQRQLVSFARAFLADPAVLILDEATSSLDVPSERLVQHALRTLLSDRTALIIAHRLSTVEIADRVLVMEDGAIVEDGTPAELVGGIGRFADLHRAWADSLV